MKSLLPILLTATAAALLPTAHALNGGRSMVEVVNGWKAIEVVTEGDEKGGYTIQSKMDGIGAFLVSANELRLQVNHELSPRTDKLSATISEINIDVNLVKQAIAEQVTTTGNTTVEFVTSLRQAWGRWTLNNGQNWNTTVASSAHATFTVITEDHIVGANVGNHPDFFCKFCSSQSYEADTFGSGKGFVDRLYITGEECNGGRVVVLDSSTRDLYVLSGVTGGPPNTTASYGGMPFDSMENAALLDTGESDHVAMLLSADGGTHTLMLYVGKKGVGVDGKTLDDGFLARNGLLYGEWWYLDIHGNLVVSDSTLVRAPKFEDIDTNPNNPTQVVLAESSSGIYMLDFDLVFDEGGTFDSKTSGFIMRKLVDAATTELVHQFSDNVDWTTNDLIFVNKDHDEGGIWYMTPQGEGKTQVGKTAPLGESTGILDLSHWLGYPPASVLVTTNQGIPSSMTLLLNPSLADLDLDATPAPAEDENACPVVTEKNQFVVQAEDAVLMDGSVATLDEDYCGDGYVVFGETSESAGIVFFVNTTRPGYYRIDVRYANGGEQGRPGVLLVNGVDQNMTFDFGATGSWSTWSSESLIVTLEDVGDTKLGIMWPNGGARPSIDSMMVERTLPPEEDREFVLPGSGGGGLDEEDKRLTPEGYNAYFGEIIEEVASDDNSSEEDNNDAEIADSAATVWSTARCLLITACLLLMYA